MSEELDRLESLLAKATPGPWDVVIDPDGPPRVYRGRSGGFCVSDRADHLRADADAGLIVGLRNAAPALLAAAREADSLREQCNVAARVASDAMREAEEWKAKALRWDAERQIVAGHYDDVRADYLELREWQREAAAELRAVNQGFTANRALVRALLARVKP